MPASEKRLLLSTSGSYLAFVRSVGGESAMSRLAALGVLKVDVVGEVP